MKKFFILTLFTILLTACAGLTYVTTPHTVALNQANFKFVRNVTAETTATYVFGIGGMSQNANADVIERLQKNAKIQPNQALADIHIKTTTKCYLGIVLVRTLTASAAVVEFTE